jgi:hypothetical protein
MEPNISTMPLQELLMNQAKLVAWICSNKRTDPRFFRRCTALTEITRQIIKRRSGDATDEGTKTDWIDRWAKEELSGQHQDIQAALAAFPEAQVV